MAYYCHLPALRRLAGVSIVAAADVDANALARAQRLAPFAPHSRPQEVLERSDIDAVVISVPPEQHVELAIAAAGARKHFYLEKPIATSAADAQRVVDAADRAGVAAAIGFNRRWHPLFRQARTLLEAGRLGRVRAVQTAFCEAPPPDGLPVWKRARDTGGGVLLDLASHHIDLVRWFLNDEPAEVRASLESAETEDDTARVELVLRGGAIVQSFFSFRAGLSDFLEFTGELGTMRVDRHRARLTLRIARERGYGVRDVWQPPDAAVTAWWLRRLVRRSEDPSYYHALRAFARHVVHRKQDVPSLDDGRRSLTVVLAAEESHRTGRAVRLTDS